MARYLLYPAITPRRTYWRGNAHEDVAFFMQIWGPITLWGLNGGPVAGLVAGPVLGLLCYTASAWLNGEPLRLPSVIRQRITIYTSISALVGIHAAVVTTILQRAVRQEQQEQEARRQLVASLAEETERRARRQEVEHEFRRVLEELQDLVEQHLEPSAAAELLSLLRSKLANRHEPPTPTESVEAIIRAAAASANIGVSVDIDVPVAVRQELLNAIRYFSEIVLTNARIHAGCAIANVSVRVQRSTLKLSITDAGPGMPFGYHPHPNHGLGRATAFIESLGGKLEIGPGQEGGVEVTTSCPL
jgi:signal transduction histidine kinase